jgi:heptaprenyl diphosphate synthase
VVSTGDSALTSHGLDAILRVDASVTATLAAVEEALRANVAAPFRWWPRPRGISADAGGKRFRPLLVALGAQFGDPAAVENIAAANVVELTHLATLYHDDVMDEAPSPRARPARTRAGATRWRSWWATTCSPGADIAASLGPEAVHLQARTFARLVHGQIAETVGPRDADPIEHYLHVITEKTASLIATAARFGGLFSGAEPGHVEALAQYGEIIGIAFQLSDDLLDISSESVQSGKTPGTDLREGVPTLPVLYALAGDDTDASAVRLRELLSAGRSPTDALHAEALTLLRESAAMKQARETVRTCTEDARASLGPLPAGEAKRTLEALCDFIADRTN